MNSIFKLLLLVLITPSIACQSNQQTRVMLPGAKYYDVTDPASWGGDPAIAATADDDSDDDAIAINAAIAKAQELLSQESNEWNFQQIIYVPAGRYHLRTPIIVPKIIEVTRHRSRPTLNSMAIWLQGSGCKESTFEVVKNGDVWGTPTKPTSVVQFAEYSLDGYISHGNHNFQLFASDFAIEIPDNLPYTVGISWGGANHGGVNNVNIRAGKNSGYTGLALTEYNNGPGLIRNMFIEGFNTGVEIHDGWGETYGLQNITCRNQCEGGTAFFIADKQITIEGLYSEQSSSTVLPIHLSDDKAGVNSSAGGFPHLILVGGKVSCSEPSSQPVVKIDCGHSYIRDLECIGYAKKGVVDHGVAREITSEYVSIHGKTAEQRDNVAVSYNAPAESLRLPIKKAPKWDKKALFSLFDRGDYTTVDHTMLKDGALNVATSWVIVDPRKEDDDTQLLQAALNSGAKYVGLLNHEPLLLSAPIVVNGKGSPKKVELIFGHMTDIDVAESFYNRPDVDTPSTNTLFTLETGESETLFIDGIHFVDGSKMVDSYFADFTLFYNNAKQCVVFEDVRSKFANKSYLNGEQAYGEDVFFTNVEFAYNGVFCDVLVDVVNQNVWGRQFNIEGPITSLGEHIYQGKECSFYSEHPRLRNRGGNVWVILSKLGEHHGVFTQVEDGGKSEHLGVFFNICCKASWIHRVNAPNGVVIGKGSELSLVGQERLRAISKTDPASSPIPHQNRFVEVINTDGEVKAIKGTELPTYLKIEGIDPFAATDYTDYKVHNLFRVCGVLRVAAK
ncbi:MAG: glycosyl hydrolase family 28-related protein [Rikenellaceae bacterium]